MKPKVTISGHFLRNDSAMMRVIDAGYMLKNRANDEQRDTAIFDIEGPDVPDCELVEICMCEDGRVWVQESQANRLSIEDIVRYFNIPKQKLVMNGKEHTHP